MLSEVSAANISYICLFYSPSFFFLFSSQCLLSPSTSFPHHLFFNLFFFFGLNCLTCTLRPWGDSWAEIYLAGANWQMQPFADKTGGLVGSSSFTFSQQENKILFLEKDSVGAQTCQDSSQQQLPDLPPLLHQGKCFKLDQMAHAYNTPTHMRTPEKASGKQRARRIRPLSVSPTMASCGA